MHRFAEFCSMHRNLFFILLLPVLLTACSTARKTVDFSEYKAEKNVAYGPHKRQKLDAYVVKNTDRAKPVVMLIHGGAWVRGNKVTLQSVQKMLAKNGYNSVNINYRLVTKTRSSCAQLEDIATARVVADSIFGGKPLVLLGESAGGHLSYLYGYENADNIAGIISLSGPASLIGKDYTKSLKRFVAKPLLKKVTGCSNDEHAVPLAFHVQSPVQRISNVPTLLIHGKLDYLVNIRQAYEMQKALEEMQVENRLVTINYAGHVGRLNPIIRNRIVYPEILEFLAKRSIP